MPLNFSLSDLVKKRLWIVTGKGGVGKTTLSAALGLMCAKMGLKTLLVETHSLNHLGELLEVGNTGYHAKKVRTNLSLAQLTSEKTLEEYVLRQIRFRFIYNAVFNNKYVRHFIDAAPGLIELLTIGKIWSLVEEGGGRPKTKYFDIVIVDAPSTGHGLSLLTVPEVVVSAVRVGPLKTKSENILSLLRDREKTLVWLATLPEEMPVSETVDMVEKLASQVKMQLGPIMVNALWPEIVRGDSLAKLKKTGIDLPRLDIYEKRLEQSRYYFDKIRGKLSGKQFIELPLLYHTHRPLELSESLSKVLHTSLNSKK